MASVFKKTMAFLGLAPEGDEYYGDEETLSYSVEEPRDGSQIREHESSYRDEKTRLIKVSDLSESAQRHIKPSSRVAVKSDIPEANEIREIDRSGAQVRLAQRYIKPYACNPTKFADVQEVADRLKANQPVIINLQIVDDDLRKRLIDFCSGVTYAISGSMEKVADKVYLMTPSNVEVSLEERRRFQRKHTAR